MSEKCEICGQLKGTHCCFRIHYQLLGSSRKGIEKGILRECTPAEMKEQKAKYMQELTEKAMFRDKETISKLKARINKLEQKAGKAIRQLKDCREFNDKAITLLLHTDNYFGENITRSQMSSIVEETERR